MPSKSFGVLLIALSCAAFAACSDDDEPSNSTPENPGAGGTSSAGTGGTSSSGAGGSSAGSEAGGAGGSEAGGMGGMPMPQMVDPSAETKAIWDKLSGYQSWSKFPEQTTPTMSESHMKMFVLSYYNDVVGQAEKDGVMPLPDGSIIVKDNFMKADDSMPMAVTVMAKQGGEWYWIEAAPDGKVILDDAGKPLEGKGVGMCVGCHTQWKDNDYVGTHKFGSGSGGSGGSGGSMPMAADPSPETKAVWDKLSGYQSWPTFPNASTPTMSESHMKMFVLARHNDVVAKAITDKTLPLPDGAIIVKDNFMKADDSMPMAVTVMSKQGGKWYWFEAMPDGKVILDDAGKPLEGFDVPMCVGCHTGWKDNDYVGTYDFQP